MAWTPRCKDHWSHVRNHLTIVLFLVPNDPHSFYIQTIHPSTSGPPKSLLITSLTQSSESCLLGQIQVWISLLCCGSFTTAHWVHFLLTCTHHLKGTGLLPACGIMGIQRLLFILHWVLALGTSWECFCYIQHFDELCEFPENLLRIPSITQKPHPQIFSR